MTRDFIISQIQHALQCLPYDMDISLFGSEARGEAKKDSDIDLLILIDTPQISLQYEENIMACLYPIELSSGIAINPIILAKEEWEKRKTPLHENIMKEGKKL